MDTHLSPETLRIASERSAGWEYRLLLRAWADEVDRRADLVHAYEAGLASGSAETVRVEDAAGWLQTRVHELQGFVQSANRLINVEVPRTIAKPGEPGDASRILWIASALGSALDDILRWAMRVRCARIESPFEEIGTRLSPLIGDLVEQFRTFPRDALGRMERALALARGGQVEPLDLKIVFRLANVEGLDAAFDRAAVRLGARTEGR